MALADYKLCDVCGRKTYYDANLNFDLGDRGPDGFPVPDGAGDLAALCRECVKTHEIVIATRGDEGDGDDE